MKSLPWENKFVAIEPLMKCDLDIFEKWIREIKPKMVSISYNNYRKGPNDPIVDEAISLCKRLSRFTTVLPHGDWVKDKEIRKKLKRAAL